MPLPLKTERLRLRLWTGDDAAVLWELNEDTEVLRYTGDENFQSVAAMREFLLAYDQYTKYQMGRLVVELLHLIYVTRYGPDCRASIITMVCTMAI